MLLQEFHRVRAAGGGPVDIHLKEHSLRVGALEQQLHRHLALHFLPAITVVVVPKLDPMVLGLLADGVERIDHVLVVIQGLALVLGNGRQNHIRRANDMRSIAERSHPRLQRAQVGVHRRRRQAVFVQQRSRLLRVEPVKSAA